MGYLRTQELISKMFDIMTEMSDKKCDKKLKSVFVKTPIGDITITVCANGLHRLSRPNVSTEPNLQINVEIKDEDFGSKNKLIGDSVKWLTDYFQSGQENEVPPFCPTVTRSEFNRKVWSTLMNGTKFGQTISYSSLGASLGKPSAGRAVGTAMKNNPLILMIPCHRVVKKDGTPGNYSAGNSLKEWLISFERDFTDK